MAEESYFDRFFNTVASRENNQGLYNLGDIISELPANALDYLKQEGQVAKDQIGSLADFAFDNPANDAIEEFMASEADTQGGQAFRKGLEFFRGLGETGIDKLAVPFEKAQEGIEFLKSDSDFVLAEKEKAKQIENQRLIELDPLGEFSGMGPQIVPDFESLDIDPAILSGLDVEVDADKATAASRESEIKRAEELKARRDSFAKNENEIADAMVSRDEKIDKKLSPEDQEKNTEDGFAAAMKDFMAASGRDLPSKNESRSDSIARYKKEFEEVTGIDASGKPDKSRFLMALGLNLMQNKAGKNFDFSRIIDEGAKAVEDAMPMLTKAADKAEAASLAAGKFALGEIKAGESAAAAFAKEVRTNNFSWQLKKLELSEKARAERIKAGASSNKIENIAPVSIGAGDIKVRIGDVQRDGEGVNVFASPATDAGAVVNSYMKYTSGQENVALMGDALTAIADSNVSGLKILADRAKSVGASWGVVDGKDMFGEKGISNEAEFKKLRQATINAFKKLILQESQISNLDLKTLFESFGEVSFMQNPREAEFAIDLMADYFAAKKASLKPVLSDFSDRSWFNSKVDYDRTQDKLSKLGGTFTGQATSGEDGRLRIDLSAIPKLNVED